MIVTMTGPSWAATGEEAARAVRDGRRRRGAAQCGRRHGSYPARREPAPASRWMMGDRQPLSLRGVAPVAGTRPSPLPPSCVRSAPQPRYRSSPRPSRPSRLVRRVRAGSIHGVINGCRRQTVVGAHKGSGSPDGTPEQAGSSCGRRVRSDRRRRHRNIRSRTPAWPRSVPFGATRTPLSRLRPLPSTSN